MIAATTRKLHFLPYRFDDRSLALRVERFVLDGQRDVASACDAERPLLDLSTSRWTRADAEVSVAVDAALLDAVFPPDERDAPAARLLATVACAATRLRRVVVLHDGPLRPGAHRARFKLSIDELRGAVEVTPWLVRRGDRPDADDGYATGAHQRLAVGRALEIRVDPVVAHGDYLDVKYEHFRDKGPPQFPRPDALYQLDAEGDTPVLWLNLDHQRVCTVLDSAGTVGRVARMREVVFGQLAQAVWTQLFWRAAWTVQRVGEPVHEWEEAVLGRVLPDVYPDAPDLESCIAALRAELDASQGHAVMARLDGALQDQLAIARRASDLAEELE